MRLGKEIITLRTLSGTYAGQLQDYEKTAGENALAFGFAELPIQEEEPEVQAPAPVAELGPPPGDDSFTPLPEDFPGLPLLLAAGLETIEAVTKVEDLRTVDGIGKSTERKITDYLEGLLG